MSVHVDRMRLSVAAATRWQDVVATYAAAIEDHAGDFGEPWPSIHAPMLARWSKRTLSSIKREAWKLFS